MLIIILSINPSKWHYFISTKVSASVYPLILILWRLPQHRRSFKSILPQKLLKSWIEYAQDNLMKAQSDMIQQANCQCHIKDFAVGNEVMINIWNLVSDWSMRALNNKRCKPFRILQQFHFFYKLNVLSKWYTTDIFHISDFTRVTDLKWLPLTE